MKNKILKILFLTFIFCFSIVSYVYALSPQSELKYQGIDVSDWQGYIDYNQVKNSGIEVVYIKASQGVRIKDPYVDINYENAKANGLKVGFYHFLEATNVEEAYQEAAFFISVISGKQSDCKLVLDYEQFNGVGREQINQIALAFIQRVKELTNKQVIVYSDLSNAESTFDSEVANNAELWLAYYGDYLNLQNVNSSWNSFIGVQYTSRGSVPGIRGNVDRDLYSQEIFLDDSTEIPSIENPTDNFQTEVINYTVKRGDTLGEIASRFGTTVQEIADLNGIQNVNLIYPGEVLRITTNSNVHGDTVNATGKTIYTIKRGDNLWNISRRYGTTVQNIVNWNGIRNPNLIYPGQRIVIYTRAKEVNNQYYSYTVRRGDNLWRIARRFRVSVNRIARLNGIQNPRMIYVGQILKI